MHKIAVLFILAIVLQKPVTSSAQLPCSQPEFRQFDFWIGQWEAFQTNGQKAGDSKIEMILDSCIILENWTSSSVVKGLRYAGKSYNTWNTRTKKWQQYWVDNTGGITEYFDGHYEDNKMIMQTANIAQPEGGFKIMKMTFYKLSKDKVRQFGELSTDEGKTWKTDFDLEYRRKL